MRRRTAILGAAFAAFFVLAIPVGATLITTSESYNLPDRGDCIGRMGEDDVWSFSARGSLAVGESVILRQTGAGGWTELTRCGRGLSSIHVLVNGANARRIPSLRTEMIHEPEVAGTGPCWVAPHSCYNPPIGPLVDETPLVKTSYGNRQYERRHCFDYPVAGEPGANLYPVIRLTNTGPYAANDVYVVVEDRSSVLPWFDPPICPGFRDSWGS